MGFSDPVPDGQSTQNLILVVYEPATIGSPGLKTAWRVVRQDEYWHGLMFLPNQINHVLSGTRPRNPFDINSLCHIRITAE